MMECCGGGVSSFFWGVKTRPCGVVDWLALHPEYNPKIKVILKKDHHVLVDVTF